MGRIASDAKKLILGNDGSDNEPVDFKIELQNAIKAGLVTKADGTLLITSRTNCDKLAAEMIKSEEKEIAEAAKENGIEFETLEEAKEYEAEQLEKKKEKDRKQKERELKEQEQSLEQQIQASQNAAKAKIASEKKLEKDKQIERK